MLNETKKIPSDGKGKAHIKDPRQTEKYKVAAAASAKTKQFCDARAVHVDCTKLRKVSFEQNMWKMKKAVANLLLY